MDFTKSLSNSRFGQNFQSSNNDYKFSTLSKYDYKIEENKNQLNPSVEKESYVISNKLVNDEDWEKISNIVSHSNIINNLEFSGININGNGLKALSDLVIKNKQIKTLILEWNYINEFSDDFDYFCEGISHAHHLNYLYLKNNKLISSHSKSIAKILKNNQGLLYLDLRWNDIGNEGARILLNSINNCINEIVLIGNKIDESLLNEINEKLNRNKNLTYNYYVNNEKSKSNKFDLKDGSIEDKQIAEPSFKTSVKIIEKEKEISEEMKARYDVQIIANSKLERKIKELELMLDNERHKCEEIKINVFKELQLEKELRIKYEENVLKLKEEIMIKEIEHNRNLQELEIKLSSLYQENSCYINESKLLKDQNERLRYTYEEKYRNLEENFGKNTNFLNETIENLRNEIDKVRKEYQDDLKTNNKDWERKVKSLEESFKSIKSQKDELEKENSILKRDFLDFRVEKEIEFKEREALIISEEKKKLESAIKNAEQRIKTLELSKEEMNQSLQYNLNEGSNSKRSQTDELITMEGKINQLQIDKTNLEKKIVVMNNTITKLNSESNVKEGIINKLKNDVQEMTKNIEKLNFNFNQNSENQLNEFNQTKNKMKKECEDLKLKIKENQLLIENLKNKLAKIESDDMKFSETFKKSFVQFIDDNFKEKYNIS